MRLAVVSLLTSVPLLLGLPAAAHAASHDPVLRRTAPGQRLAAAIALRASDFPGWTRTSNSGSGGNFDCPRVSIDESHHIVNGERERWFQHAGAGEFAYAGGTALVYKDAWMATETFRQAHNPALAICLREMLNKQQERTSRSASPAQASSRSRATPRVPPICA